MGKTCAFRRIRIMCSMRIGCSLFLYCAVSLAFCLLIRTYNTNICECVYNEYLTELRLRLCETRVLTIYAHSTPNDYQFVNTNELRSGRLTLTHIHTSAHGRRQLHVFWNCHKVRMRWAIASEMPLLCRQKWVFGKTIRQRRWCWWCCCWWWYTNA